MVIKPLIVKDIDREKAGIVASLLVLAISAASYPLLFDTRRLVVYSGLFISTLSLMCYCFGYWKHLHKSFIVFKMDESGVYYYDKGAHFYEWAALKQVSVRYAAKENGNKTRLLFLTIQDDTEYRFNIFYFVISYVWTIHRLKKAVPFFSNGSVSFKYYPILNRSSYVKQSSDSLQR